MILKENNKEIIDRKDNKNISIELFTIIMTKIDKKSLLIGYKFIKNRIIYNKIWDKTIKLFIIKKIHKIVVKISKFRYG